MLTVDQIRLALTRLGELAHREHIDLDVFLVGGSALAWAFGTRNSTQDVDAVIVNPEDKRKLYGLIQQVAEEQELDAKWLNESAARYVTRRSDGPVILQTRGITVRRASAAQLLGMKLMAWRSRIDQQDSRDVLRQLRLRNRGFGDGRSLGNDRTLCAGSPKGLKCAIIWVIYGEKHMVRVITDVSILELVGGTCRARSRSPPDGDGFACTPATLQGYS